MIDGIIVPRERYQIEGHAVISGSSDTSYSETFFTEISQLDTNTSVAPLDILVQCTARQGEPYNHEVKSGVYNVSYAGTH